ncbi:MAG: LPXTG cell wall anchor domain-containing protein [Clostridiales bacterium]|nr:LPXTG cell wall anchor domain-containing protein [Clostridiales bacterium]
MRKILTALLVLALMLSMAVSALAADDGPIWVGNVMLRAGDYLLKGAVAPVSEKPTNPHAGYAHYDGHILTLKDFQIGVTYQYGMGYSAAIYSNHPIRINLLGDNEISSSCSGIVIMGTTDKDDVWIQDLSRLDPSKKGTLRIKANHVGIYTNDNLNIAAAELWVESDGNMGFTGEGIVSTIGAIDLWGDTYVNVEAAQTAMIAGKGLGVPGTAYARLQSYYSNALRVYDGKLIVSDNGILYTYSQSGKALSLSTDVEYSMGYHIIAEGYKDGINRDFYVENAHSFKACKEDFEECKKVVFVQGEPMYIVSVTDGKTSLRYGSEVGYKETQEYREGKEVALRANEPQAGYVFSYWENLDSVEFAEGFDKSMAYTVIKMPNRRLEPKAVYTDTHTCSTSVKKNDADYHWQECESCGTKDESTYGAHNYKMKHDGSRHWQECSVCGWVDVTTISLHWYNDEGSALCVCGNQKPITDRVIAPDSIKDVLVPLPDDRTKPIEIVKPDSGPSYELDKEKVDYEELPKYPITITKKTEGVAVKDLPDDIVFVFDVYDLKTGEISGSYRVTKWDMMHTGTVSIPVFVTAEFWIEETVLDLSGRLEANKIVAKPIGVLEVHPDEDDVPSVNGSLLPVGGFKYNDPYAVSMLPGGDPEPDGGEDDEDDGFVEIEPGQGIVGPNLPYNPNGRMRTMGPASAEIVITNYLTYRPIDLPKTGDESDILLWLSLAMTSMVALMLISRRKREA